jgi:hypothetical protein
MPALILMVVLILTLAACVNGNDAPSGSDATTTPPPSSEIPETTQPTVEQPAPSPSDTPPQDTQPSALAIKYLNDDGTIAFPAEIEALAEDATYFVPTTDDFTLVQNIRSDAIVLTLLCFDSEGNAVSGVERWWFKDGKPEGLDGFGINFGLSNEIARNGNGTVDELQSGDLVYITPDEATLANLSSAYETAKEHIAFLYKSYGSTEEVQYWFSISIGD